MSCAANRARERLINVHRSFFVVRTRLINVCEFKKMLIKSFLIYCKGFAQIGWKTRLVCFGSYSG